MEVLLLVQFVTVGTFLFFFLNLIPVPKGTDSVLCLGFMNTGWRALIKNTFPKQPCSLTQNFHCLLLAQSWLHPLLLLLSLHYLKPNVDLVNFLFECKPISWSYFSIVALKIQGFPCYTSTILTLHLLFLSLFFLMTSTIGYFQVYHLITPCVSDTLNSSSLYW